MIWKSSSSDLDYDKLAKTILRIVDGHADENARYRLLCLYQSIEENFFVDLHALIKATLHRDSKSHEINVPALMVGVELQTALRTIFTQLLRQPLDLGFEAEFEAADNDKGPKGQVEVHGKLIGKTVELLIRNGGGLHLAKLKVLAAAKEINYSDLETLADVIFCERASSPDHLPTASRRSDSMEAVGAIVRGLGGSINIILLDYPNLTSDTVPFCFRITLPLEQFFLRIVVTRGR